MKIKFWLVFLLLWQGRFAFGNDPPYRYQISASLIFQDEAGFLKEWD